MRRRILGAVLLGLSVLVPVAGCGGDDDDSGSAFCDLENQGDINPSTPEGAQQAVEVFDKALGDAPDEVKADLQKVRDILSDFVIAPPDPADPTLGGRAQELNDAAQRVADFGDANC